MCLIEIETVPSYRYKGVLFDDEAEALAANIRDIGEDLKKNHHANPGKGILEHREVLELLLIRYNDLRGRPSMEATSEKAEPPYSNKRLAAIQGAFLECRGATASAIQNWLGDRNYATMTAFLTSGPSGKRITEVETILGLRDEDED